MPQPRLFLYRAILAFTVGIFLSCAARISEAHAGEAGAAESARASTDAGAR